MIPSMISAQEADYLRRAPYGRVVEHGCWLGASTLALLDNPRVETLLTYDNFKWCPYMEEAYKRQTGEPSGITDRFFAQYKRNVGQDVRHNIVACELSDTYGVPNIDFLFLDAWKSQFVVKHCLPLWFSNVHVGGLIADQDFLYYPGPRWWFVLPMMHMVMDNVMDIAHVVGTTVVFHKKKEVDFNEYVNWQSYRFLLKEFLATFKFMENLFRDHYTSTT